MSLVIGFLLISLIQSKKSHLIKSVLGGTIFGILISILAGFTLFITIGQLEGQVEQFVVGGIQLISAMLIFYFVFWLSNQSSSKISSKLKSKVVIKGHSISLFVMASIFVIREGIELVLFILSNSDTLSINGVISIVFGIAVSIVIALIFIKTTINLNIKVIFTLLGFLLIFFGGRVFTEGITSFLNVSSLFKNISFYGFVISALLVLFKNNLLQFFKKNN